MTFDVHAARPVPAGGLRRHAAGDPRRPRLLPRRAAQPADLPAHGRGARRVRVRHRSSRTPSVAHALGFAALAIILAEGGLTTTWREVRPVDAARGSRWRPSGVAVVGRRGGRRRPLPARAAVGARGAARRGHLADRRGRGVLGAARGAAAASAGRRARGRVRAQRRPDRRAGDPDLDRRRASTTGSSAPPGSSSASWRSAWSPGSAFGFGGAWLMRRAALPSSGLYPIAVLCLAFARVRRRRGRPRLRLRRGLRRRAGARQQRAAAPRGHPVVRRGGRLARPDRAVRDARAAALAGPDRPRRPSGSAVVAGLILTFVARPLSVVVELPSSRPMPLARAGLPLLGRAARRGPDRAHHHPAGGGGRRRRAALRHRLRDGRDLHPAHRTDAAVGRPAAPGRPPLRAARPRRRGGARSSGSRPTCCR